MAETLIIDHEPRDGTTETTEYPLSDVERVETAETRFDWENSRLRVVWTAGGPSDFSNASVRFR